MLRQRSPHYQHRMSPRRLEGRGTQRFPWDDPDFDPDRVVADLDRLPWADIPPDLREDMNRRPRSPGGYNRPGNHHSLPLDDYRRRSPSPPRSPGYRELSPKRTFREREGDGGRRGGGGRGIRKEMGRFEDRQMPPHHSPQRQPRERLPSTGPHPGQPSMGWGREETMPGQGRTRGRGSREKFQDQGRGGARERGGGESRGMFDDRRRAEPLRDRSPHADRYNREAEFREHPHSSERPREIFGGGPGGPREHDRAAFEDQRGRDPSLERAHYPAGSSQERFRKPNIREEARGHTVHDSRRDPGHEPRRSSPMDPEGRRSPVFHERTSPVGFPRGREGPVNHRGSQGHRGGQGFRGRGGQAHRGRGNTSRGGRMDFGPSRNEQHSQPFPHRNQAHSSQHQKQSVRPRETDWDLDAREEQEDEEEEPGWGQEPQGVPRWEENRPRGGGGRPQPTGPRRDPLFPRAREPNWKETKSVQPLAAPRAHTVVEETLTIKVDMNRRVGQNR